MWDFIKNLFVTVYYVAIEIYDVVYDEITDQRIPTPIINYIVVGTDKDVDDFLASHTENEIYSVLCYTPKRRIKTFLFGDKDFMNQAKSFFPDDDEYLAAFKLYLKRKYILFNVDNVHVVNMRK